MRSGDLLRLAVKSTRAGAAASAVFVAAAVLFSCASAAGLAKLGEEKAQPWEMTVTAPGGLSDRTVAEIRAIPGVKAASGVIRLAATVKCGTVQAELTLLGIDGDYLERDYLQGGPFPSGGSMPRLVFSEGAVKQFRDPEGTAGTEVPELVDRPLTLALNDSEIPAGASGVFTGETVETYLSLETARALLERLGQPAGYAYIAVRVRDAGAADAVAKAVAALGCTAENSDGSRQADWDARTREAAYLCLLAGAWLLCAGMCKRACRAENRRTDSRMDEVLRGMGLPEGELRRLHFLRGVLWDALGTAAGMLGQPLLAVSVPEQWTGLAAFAVPASGPALLIPAAISLGISMLL